MKSFFVCALLIAFSQTGFSRIPKDFELLDHNKISEDLFYELNAGNDFLISNTDGKLNVNAGRPPLGVKLRLNDGMLIALDFGEFGGYLEFFKDSGESIRKNIPNINAIFKLGDSIYYTTGLGHLDLNIGSLCKLEIDGNSFKTTQIIDFKSTVYAAAVYGDKIYVAAYSGFYAVENLKPALLVKTDVWNGLYPNSIAVFDDENIYIGMREAVAKVNAKEKDMQFFRYKGPLTRDATGKIETKDGDIEKSLERYAADNRLRLEFAKFEIENFSEYFAYGAVFGDGRYPVTLACVAYIVHDSHTNRTKFFKELFKGAESNEVRMYALLGLLALSYVDDADFLAKTLAGNVHTMRGCISGDYPASEVYEDIKKIRRESHFEEYLRDYEEPFERVYSVYRELKSKRAE